MSKKQNDLWKKMGFFIHFSTILRQTDSFNTDSHRIFLITQL